ncbi:hypothetical protein DCAR_0935616 [Daucus carota subsp. sativus]|uniref:Uncharacterized protein n=1 Tax=Daucus carota subsp. sativus TaxID=79200 RepID=A0A175YHC5_DAUCS|nr:hypothetical protein DCAR_0935616 [Daucus carota subsp. sativus]
MVIFRLLSRADQTGGSSRAVPCRLTGRRFSFRPGTEPAQPAVKASRNVLVRSKIVTGTEGSAIRHTIHGSARGTRVSGSTGSMERRL